MQWRGRWTLLFPIVSSMHPTVPMTTRVALLGGKWTCKRQQSFNHLCNYFSSVQVADIFMIRFWKQWPSLSQSFEMDMCQMKIGLNWWNSFPGISRSFEDNETQVPLRIIIGWIGGKRTGAKVPWYGGIPNWLQTFPFPQTSHFKEDDIEQCRAGKR